MEQVLLTPALKPIFFSKRALGFNPHKPGLTQNNFDKTS
jgi:hypothetical protein